MCALPKKVKSGGSYYKGYKLTVDAGTGDYVQDMTETTASVVNGITVIPDTYGSGDYFKLEHLDADSNLVETIADTIYNVGANAAWYFDFASLEKMGANHKFRLTYTNVAGVALSVYISIERIK